MKVFLGHGFIWIATDPEKIREICGRKTQTISERDLCKGSERKDHPVTVTRIGEFQAKEWLIEDLKKFLLSIVPMIKSSKGCELVQLYQSQEKPSKFVMIEVWDSAESHQASVKNIPPEKLGEVKALLAASPGGSYFGLVHQQ